MVHVLATIELAAGARARFLEEFRDIVPLVRAEDGCIEYGATVDLETDIERQAPLRVDVVTIIEKWRDVSALEAHLRSEHMAAYRDRVKALVQGSTLRVLAPA